MVLGGLHRRRQAVGKRLHDPRIVPPAAADHNLARRLAQHLEPDSHGLGHEGDQGRSRVLQFAGFQRFEGEIEAIEGLGRRRPEIGVAQQAGQNSFVDPTDAGVAPLVVEASGAPGLDQQVDHAVARASVEGGDPAVFRDEGDIGDAADVEHRERGLQSRGPGAGQVVDGGQRRALPAGRHVGGAEVVGHRHAGPAGQQRGVTQLDRATGDAVPWPFMQYRLAMHADQVDVGPG